MLVEEIWKKTAVPDVPIPSYGAKRNNEHKNLENEQGMTVEVVVAYEDISDPRGNQSNGAIISKGEKGNGPANYGF